MKVLEYHTFEEALNKSEVTLELLKLTSTDYIDQIKSLKPHAFRFFVGEDKRFYFFYKSVDGLKILNTLPFLKNKKNENFKEVIFDQQTNELYIGASFFNSEDVRKNLIEKNYIVTQLNFFSF